MLKGTGCIAWSMDVDSSAHQNLKLMGKPVETKTVDLSERFIYKEISAKEFLIDNVYELVNESDNSVIIQKYFESLNEFNYNVRDLGYRKDALNYDFISSMYIGKKMTKEMLVNKYNMLPSLVFLGRFL
mgnify:CR=1 FL=1